MSKGEGMFLLAAHLPPVHGGEGRAGDYPALPSNFKLQRKQFVRGPTTGKPVLRGMILR
jgi:hypothetical protein